MRRITDLALANVLYLDQFAFFKLHHRVGGGVRGAHRHGLVPARERLCILPS
jgi:hypothetical protein